MMRFERGGAAAVSLVVAGMAVGCTGPEVGSGKDDIVARRGALVSTLTTSTHSSWGGSQTDQSGSVAVTDAGEALMAGATRSFGAGNYDIAVVKRNAGGVVWARTWGGAGNDLATGIAVGPDKNIYVTGWTTNPTTGATDMVVLKLDASGALVWERTLDYAQSDSASDLAFDAAGNIFVAGTALVCNPLACFKNATVAKLTPTGDVFWTKAYAGPLVDNEASAIAVDATGNVVVSVTTSDLRGGGAVFMCTLKMSGDGVLSWQKCWGGAGLVDLALAPTSHGITTDAAGNIYVAAGLFDGAVSFAPFLFKLTPAGLLAWSHTETQLGKLGSLALDGQGGLLVSGFHDALPSQQYFVSQLDTDGNVAGTKVWTVAGDRAEDPMIGMALGNGNVFVMGTTTNGDGSWSDGTFDLAAGPTALTAQTFQAGNIDLRLEGLNRDTVLQTGGVETGGGGMDLLLLGLTVPGALSPLGDPCTNGTTCTSGFCADGVCCTELCDGSAAGDCRACSTAAGAPSNGTCVSLTGQTCGPVPSPTSCLTTAVCGATDHACPAPVAVFDCSSVSSPSCGGSNCATVVTPGPTSSLIKKTSVKFDQPVAAGEISVQPCDPADEAAAAAVDGYQIVKSGTETLPNPTVYACADITVSASVNYSPSDLTLVCLFYGAELLDDGSGGLRDQNTLKVRHHDPVSGWVEMTATSPRQLYVPANPPIPEQLGMICANANSLSPFGIFAPIDNKPPVLAGVPGPIVAYATSTAGAQVTYGQPTAVDANEGPTAVSCMPASGETFPLGHSEITCTSSDSFGNTAKAKIPVWVQVQAATDGTFFGQPINPDGSSVFKQKSTIPVKFRLTGASAGITNLPARLYTAKVSNGVTGTFVEGDTNVAADGGNTFRYDGGQYIYNLSTKSLTTGTWTLKVDLGDDAPRSITISLR